MRIDLRGLRRLRRTTPVALIAASLAVAVAPRAASAGFFDFLFNNQNSAPQAPQASAYANPFAPAQSPQQQPLPPIQADGGGGGGMYAHCVRMCDGRYFPILAHSGTPPAQLCQSFCPASATRVFFGSSVDSAMAANGERYAEIPNAYVYRKQLSQNCTCNGRDATGLAPVDISFDTTLRPGDVVATTTGLVAYNGGRGGSAQTTDFTPVADYPGLTGAIRAKLTEMKVTPVKAEVADDRPLITPVAPRPPASVAGKRAAAN